MTGCGAAAARAPWEHERGFESRHPDWIRQRRWQMVVEGRLPEPADNRVALSSTPGTSRSATTGNEDHKHGSDTFETHTPGLHFGVVV